MTHQENPKTDADDASDQPGEAATPKAKRDALRDKLRKAAAKAGPPTEDWLHSDHGKEAPKK